MIFFWEKAITFFRHNIYSAPVHVIHFKVVVTAISLTVKMLWPSVTLVCKYPVWFVQNDIHGTKIPSQVLQPPLDPSSRSQYNVRETLYRDSVSSSRISMCNQTCRNILLFFLGSCFDFENFAWTVLYSI